MNLTRRTRLAATASLALNLIVLIGLLLLAKSLLP